MIFIRFVLIFFVFPCYILGGLLYSNTMLVIVLVSTELKLRPSMEQSLHVHDVYDRGPFKNASRLYHRPLHQSAAGL